MAVWSKLREVSLPFNCYEVIHTWEPDCNVVALAAGGRAFYEAVKLYAPLYLVTYLLKQKFTWETTIQTAHNILISSSFLGYYGFFLHLFYCLTRKLVGSYYNVICSYFPAFAASLLCYFVERESRRRALAVYIANAATETALRMAIARDIVTPFPNADGYLFSVTMAAFLYFIKKWGFTEDAASSVMKFLLGNDEAMRNVDSESRPVASNQLLMEKILSIGIPFKDIIRGTYLPGICSTKHASCSHAPSCIIYCLQGFLGPFLVGYFVSSAILCLSIRNKLMVPPSFLTSLLTEKRNFNLGLFLGGFGGTFKVVNCMLRWYVGEDLPCFAIPAALLGGLFVKFFPSSTLSMYLLWKLIEIGYLSGIEAGIVPHVKGFQPLLLSASTALLFHAAALEPHNLKPSYFKFLKQMSYNRISLFNRRTLDIFGTHASKLRPDFWPKLDYRHTSEKFKASALLWLIP